MVGRELSHYYPARGQVTSECLFEARNLGGHNFHGISFRLYRGEILGFAGLAGAGRTDMAQAIFGDSPLSCGEIYLNGERLTLNSPSGRRALGSGYVPEERKRAGSLPFTFR